jgi:lipopolysaccharide export system permease protein
MSGFQRYLFSNVLRTLIAIVGGLAMIALLTQGLTRVEDAVENRQTAMLALWLAVLAAPQIISLLLPIALFIAAAGALNVAHRENEIVVAQASGMSNWQVASPVLRLAALAALVHLVLNLWVQPAAYREIRNLESTASADLMAAMIREGSFMSSGGLTTWAREVEGQEMRDLLVSDARNPEDVLTYIARRGYIVMSEGIPAIVMMDGHVQQLGANGAMEALKFNQSTFDLAPFVAEDRAVVLKASDRYLPELFYPDMTNYHDVANVDDFLAEGHARLAAPLLDITMAMIGIFAVLGGDFSRRGYARRIGLAAGGAVLLRLAAFGAVSAAEGDPALNVLQYALPVVVFGVFAVLFFRKPGRRRVSRILARRAAGFISRAAASP